MKSCDGAVRCAAISARCLDLCFLLIGLLWLWAVPAEGAAQTRPTAAAAAREMVYVDNFGVIRWRATGTEVALFGANYCLPSACDYRAVGHVGADRKKTVDADMAHFARMGFDGLRVTFWGDWENSDRQGNLIPNDHLDLMDYVIHRARQRGIFMLFSPIVTYSSVWPDGKDEPEVRGFSKLFKKSVLGTDPEAIAAQQNYLRQILNHVNPYTGVAIKDEPNILFVELINEPWHHSSDHVGSVRYINALADAVRETGCRKLTFHNLSEDFGIARSIRESKVDGSTFAWYPSGLNAGRELRGNFLRYVDAYPPMRAPDVLAKPTIVYEFDMPDTNNGYAYPAMARTFRQARAQFAAAFSYDMLPTAPYNLGWHTHLLNMIYTPKKAASAIIAGEVLRSLPRRGTYGSYPDNCRFGDFRVSYQQDLAELAGREKFMYSNDTTTPPPVPSALRRIVGFGSSPIVRYEGRGIYFLDKFAEGRWRLEVYPDAIQVNDAFNGPRADRLAIRQIVREWPMEVVLPDLSNDFAVRGVNEGNNRRLAAERSRFNVSPGVYVLERRGLSPVDVPEKIAGVGFGEFVCPPLELAAAMIRVSVPEEHPLGRPIRIEAEVVDTKAPQEVTVELTCGGRVMSRAMKSAGGYRFAVEIPADEVKSGVATYRIYARLADGKTIANPRLGENAGQISVVAASSPLVLLDPRRDLAALAMSRTGWTKTVLVDGSSADAPALRVDYGPDAKSAPTDLTRSWYVGDRIANRGQAGREAKSLVIRLRGRTVRSVLHVTFVEKDGTAWGAAISAKSEWSEVELPLAVLKPVHWILLPQGYPGGWNYRVEPSGRRDRINSVDVERLQFSLRKSDLGDTPAAAAGVDVERVAIRF